MADSEAYVSLAVNDTFATAALVLGDSLRDTKTCRKLTLVITSNVTQLMRNRLVQIWNDVIAVEDLNTTGISDSFDFERPGLETALCKLKIWRLTQFKKCVFLDPDTLVLQNIDELFERDELAAAPDTGWPDCFNTGVFVFVPSIETYASLVRFAWENGSFDGTDQGLLNMYFKEWSKTTSSHLPYIYNMVSSMSYTYIPALSHYGKSIKVVHFVGASKPWSQHYDYSQSRVHRPAHGQTNDFKQAFFDDWWDRYHKIQRAISSIQEAEKNQPVAVKCERDHGERNDRNQPREKAHETQKSDQQIAWERGEIDFTRRDRFTAIQHYLDNVIEGNENVESYEEDQCEYRQEQECEYHVEDHNHHEDHYHDHDHQDQIDVSQSNRGLHDFQVNINTIAYKSEEYFQNKDQTALDYNALRGNTLQETLTSGQEQNIVPVTHEQNIETVEPEELDPDQAARLRWEFGDIDFTGEDSFDRIEEYLNSLLAKMEKSLSNGKNYDEVDNSVQFSTDQETDDDSTVVSTDNLRTSGGTSPVLSLPDSAFSETYLQKPEKISRATQTSFSCISRSVQTDMDADI